MSLPALTPSLLSALQTAVNDANATKYFSAAGLVILLYDHLLTLPEEIALIWRGRPSFTKYAFLINRYIVPVMLTAITVEMCGFSGCRIFITVSSLTAVCSLGIANVLVLMRVVMLWEGNQVATRMMSGGFVLNFCTTLVLTVVALIRVYDGIEFSSITAMCTPTTTTRLLIAVWAVPMTFEILVVVSTSWNFFDRPRVVEAHLARALHQDGISFFLALAILRSLNVAMAITNKSALSLLAVFFVWAGTTLVLNRSLLHLRCVEITQAQAHLSDEFDMCSIMSQDRNRDNRENSSIPQLQNYLQDWNLQYDGDVRLDHKSSVPDRPLEIELKNSMAWKDRDVMVGAESKWF